MIGWNSLVDAVTAMVFLNLPCHLCVEDVIEQKKRTKPQIMLIECHLGGTEERFL